MGGTERGGMEKGLGLGLGLGRGGVCVCMCSALKGEVVRGRVEWQGM